jgi:hypothetical protein
VTAAVLVVVPGAVVMSFCGSCCGAAWLAVVAVADAPVVAATEAATGMDVGTAVAVTWAEV